MSSSIAEVIKIPERIVRPPTTNKGGKEVGMRDGNQPKSGMDTFTGALFEVHVGPLPAIKFTLHQTLACRACPFIEKALNGRFEEANTKVISLPEDDPEIFSEFVSYIYCDRIFNDADVDWLEYSKLWILADKLGVPGLQNLVIEKLSEKASNNERWLNISPAFLRYIYDRTLPESPLRRIFVNIATRWMQPSHARKEENSLPREFLRGLCAATMERLHKESYNARVMTQPIESFYVKTGAQDGVTATEELERKRPNKRRRMIAQGHP